MKNFHRIKPVSIFAACSLFVVTPVAAQDAPSQVELRFVAFPRVANPKPVKLDLGDGKATAVDMPSTNLSKTYKVGAMPEWNLGETAKDEEGNPVFESFGKVKALEESRQLIVAWRKGEHAETGLELTAINSTAKGFDAGTCCLINKTDTAIKGSVGGVEFTLQSGENSIITPGASEKKGTREVSYVKFSYEADDGFKVFHNSIWRKTPTVRTLAFFFTDPKTKKPKFKIIRDYVSTESP